MIYLSYCDQNLVIAGVEAQNIAEIFTNVRRPTPILDYFLLHFGFFFTPKIDVMMKKHFLHVVQTYIRSLSQKNKNDKKTPHIGGPDGRGCP